MNKNIKCLIMIILICFSFYYTSVVKELSDKNNVVMSMIDEYSINNDIKCIEGIINNDGVVLSYNGKIVDKESSYSNMKGSIFDESLIEYKKDKCILNKEDNIDKYIISANNHEKKVSIVIDIDSGLYFKRMKDIFDNEKSQVNYLVNYNNINLVSENILIKTNTDNIKKFKTKANHFYCVKYDEFDVLEYCKKEHINSIRMVNYINNNLLYNAKKMINNGSIIFIKESESNYIELYATIKYIKSRGYSIVSIDKLLS